MRLLSGVALLLMAMQYRLLAAEVPSLSFEAETFKQAFNQSEENPRLVAVLSPT